jgi:hypothetical protein
LLFFFFSPVAVAASAGARRGGSRGDGTAARSVVEPRDIFSFKASALLLLLLRFSLYLPRRICWSSKEKKKKKKRE